MNHFKSTSQKMKRHLFFYTFVAGVGVFLSACSTGNHKDHKAPGSPVFYGLAVLQPTKGNKTFGKVWFTEQYGKVKVEAEVTGLDAGTKHGFHIHEYGDCTAADASSAGGHFNPEGEIHGGHDTEKRHLGDLGNLEADKNGRGNLTIELPNVSVAGQINPLLGRSVIVHKNLDDTQSQPAGGAGPRIACGVIGAATK